VGELAAARCARSERGDAGAQAAVDRAVVLLHRAMPVADAVSFHLQVAKLFQRTGFDAYALSGLETALLMELQGPKRRDVLVRDCVTSSLSSLALMLLVLVLLRSSLLWWCNQCARPIVIVLLL
jgi:hypothetical protein